MASRSKLACRSGLVGTLSAALWISLALGHAWLLLSRWGQLGTGQALLLALAIPASLALWRWSHVFFSTPTRALIVVLLVLVAHAPGDLPAVEAATAALLAFVICHLWALGRAARPEAAAHLSPTGGLAIPARPPVPPTPHMAFALFSRPPPVLSSASACH